MYLAKNLRYLRLKYGLSQDYIANRFGYKSYTTIQKWEMGTSEPSIGVLSDLSALYGVDMDAMISTDLELGEAQQGKKIKRIPLLGTIAAGLPLLAEQNIEDHFYIDCKLGADFALRVKGDSMIGVHIYEGDLAFIRQQSTLENGEIGAILIEEEATLKKFYHEEGTIILQAENSRYAPIILKNGHVRVLGKLVAVLSMRG